MPARFYEQEVNAKLKQRRRLSAFLDERVQEYKPGIKTISLSYVFCTDAYLLNINREFLNHDTLTDIVTFDMSEHPEELAGELYISTERIAENAARFSSSYQEELHRVVFHGFLHLCGFKDKKKEEREEMRRQEDRCLQLYFKATD